MSPDAPQGESPTLLGDSRAIVRHGVLHDNLRAIRARVGPDVEILLPVKADAYGHGAVAVATRAQAAGVVDAFGVATVAEGVELRRAGVRLPILKFSPAPPRDLLAAIRADLVLTVSGQGDLRALVSALGSSRPDDVPAGGVGVHIKVDTGMGRVGVPVRRAVDDTDDALGERPDLVEVADLAAAVEASDGLRLDGAFTHLAAADVPAEDAFTQEQLALFAEAVAAVETRIGRRPDRVHAANSAGVLAHPDSWQDMVRPGIMSYGYLPDASTPRNVDVRPCLEWRGRLSVVKTVLAGSTIGYGRTWSPGADTRVGTVPLGYADGLDRHLSSRGQVEVGGEMRPIAGRICMDQFMIDLGPESTAAAGDEVVILGPARTAADVAADLDTIPYEVLCAIGPRVPREHIDPS